MKPTIHLLMLFFVVVIPNVSASGDNHLVKLDKENPALLEIRNFHFVSPKLASSGILKLEKYQNIKQYGFKHVINLIPGNQKEERTKVESLGLSYQQIPVEWSEPTLENFERFMSLMKQYGDTKVYVHCEANYRASTFVYLFRVLELGISEQQAEKDLLHIWKPSPTWSEFIEKVKFSLQE